MSGVRTLTDPTPTDPTPTPRARANLSGQVAGRPLALLVAPFRDRTPEEAAELERAKETLLGRGFAPLFLPDTLAAVLSDDEPRGRLLALECSSSWSSALARVEGARAFVVGGRLTRGMELDLFAWREAGGGHPEELAT